MKRKAAVSLIAVAIIIIVAMFAGCIEKQTPAPMPSPPSILTPRPTSITPISSPIPTIKPSPTSTPSSSPTPSPTSTAQTKIFAETENAIVEGLIANPPDEIILTELKPHITAYLPTLEIYPYVLFNKDGLYLILSDHKDILPTERKIVVWGKEYHFHFSAGKVTGTLLKLKNPLEEIDLGKNWKLKRFTGIIIAESVKPLEPEAVSVKEINSNPEKYAFKRVKVDGGYLVATATAEYGGIKIPMGIGLLADDFVDFLEIDRAERLKKRLPTLDPERKTWQLRKGEIIGTVLYPTCGDILKYIDNLPSLVRERVKPVLVVDTLVDDIVEVTDISEVNRITGDPSRYWGKVVEFEGYALGVEIPLKNLAGAITQGEIPANVNFRAVLIADKPEFGSMEIPGIASIGLDNEVMENESIIAGKYKFRIAVTEMPKLLIDYDCKLVSCDTAFFLLSKERMPMEIGGCFWKCRERGYSYGICRLIPRPWEVVIEYDGCPWILRNKCCCGPA